MTNPSPLHTVHEQAAASFLVFGDPDAGGAPVVATFGEPATEYAALRKGCALFDWPQRATVRVTGPDRLEFLNRMLTQELKNLQPGDVRRSFWLNRKGRIDADLRVLLREDDILLDADVLTVARLVESLGSFIIMEEVELLDETAGFHRLALHGPTAPLLLGAVADGCPDDLSEGRAAQTSIAGRPVLIDRQDSTCGPGFELLLSAADVPVVYQRLLERGRDADEESAPVRLRPAGWHAYNIARIESGSPVFNIDFGTDAIPNETGVLEDRISFTKGCYLGQEVVARIRSLGHPKRRLVALRAAADALEADQQPPIEGSAILPPDEPEGDAMGAVTSATRSPMLGGALVCFAQVKWEIGEPGSAVLIETPSGAINATVQPSLASWSGR